MKRRRKKEKEELSEKEILKFAEQLGYEVEPKERKQTNRASKPEQTRDNIVGLWRDKMKPMWLQHGQSKRQQSGDSLGN